MVFRRILIMLEGLVNFFVSQLWRLKLQRDLNRLQPMIDRFRCFPPVERYELQPGALEFLQSLRPNYQLALVTVRRQDEIAHFLQQNGLDESLFSAIVTRDEVTNSLPQSDQLKLVLERLNLLPEQILMVSDTDANLRAARAMEMATAGALSGLGIASLMTDADIIVVNTDELREWL